jgi:DNA-binding transcriptional ArsR family regulator
LRERLLSRPAGLRALAAGTRQEIVDVLTSSGPATVAQLGRLLGRRPDALYFHLKVLERAGLVVRREPDTGSGRATAVFAVPVLIRLDYRRGSRRELARVVRHAVRLSQREFEHECVAGRPVGSGRRRRLWGGRVMGWVAARELERVNALLHELHEVLRSGRPGPGRQAMALGFLLAPAGLGDRRRATKRAGKDRSK